MKVFPSRVKFILYIFIVGVIVSCASKRHIGTYSYRVGDPYETDRNSFYVDGKLTLNQDGTFTYYRFSTLRSISSSSKRGMGEYKIEKDTLVLEFAGYPSNIIAEVDSIKSVAIAKSILDRNKTVNESNENSRISVEVYVNSLDSILSLPVARVSFLDERKRHYSSHDYTSMTDIDGKAKLRINKSDFPADLEISSTGYYPIKLRLDESNFDYYFKILLTSQFEVAEYLDLGEWVHGIRKIRHEGDSLKVGGKYWIKIGKDGE